MSRFILNLLAVALDDGSAHIRTSQWRSIQFSPVAETMGADLHSVSLNANGIASLSNSGIEDDELQQYYVVV